MDNKLNKADELEQVKKIMLDNQRLTKANIQMLSNISFDLGKKIDNLTEGQKNIAHQLDMLISASKQLIEGQNKIYSGKDMYNMFKTEGLTHSQIAKRCGCSVSTVKRHINNYKNTMFNMEV